MKSCTVAFVDTALKTSRYLSGPRASANVYIASNTALPRSVNTFVVPANFMQHEHDDDFSTWSDFDKVGSFLVQTKANLSRQRRDSQMPSFQRNAIHSSLPLSSGGRPRKDVYPSFRRTSGRTGLIHCHVPRP